MYFTLLLLTNPLLDRKSERKKERKDVDESGHLVLKAISEK